MQLRFVLLVCTLGASVAAGAADFQDVVITMRGPGGCDGWTTPCPAHQPVTLALELHGQPYEWPDPVYWRVGWLAPTFTAGTSITATFDDAPAYVFIAAATSARGYTTNRLIANGYLTAPKQVIGYESAGVVRVPIHTSFAPVSVDYETSGPGAGTRFMPVSGRLDFAAGEFDQVVEVPLIQTAVDDGESHFGLRLFHLTNGVVIDPLAGLDRNAEYTEATVDVAMYEHPTHFFWSEPAIYTREGESVHAAIERAVPAPAEQVSYDINGVTGVASFARNERMRLIPIDTPSDVSWSGTRFWPLRLDGGSTATLVIADWQKPPVVSIDDTRLPEGNGSNTATLTLTSSAAASAPFTVECAATVPNVCSAPVLFAPGETAKTISIPIDGDREIGPDRTIVVELTGTCCNPEGPRIGKARGIVTILNDDFAMSPAVLNITRGSAATAYLHVAAVRPGAGVISCSSSAPAVGAVDQTIPITTTTVAIPIRGLARGSARIDCALPDAYGSARLSSVVNVFEPATLTFDRESIALVSGERATIHARLAPAEEGTLTITGYDSNVVAAPATVALDASGAGAIEIVARAAGSTVVGVTLPGTYGGGTVYFRVSVTTAPRARGARH